LHRLLIIPKSRELNTSFSAPVLTEVTVKLHPIPAYVLAASCAFDDLHCAAEAVANIRMMGIPVSRIELLDEMSIRAFNQSLITEGCGDGGEDDAGALRLKPMELKPTLFIEFASHSEISAHEDLSAAKKCVADFGGKNFVSAADEFTRHALWAARHRLYYSAIALRAGGGDCDDGPTAQSTIVTDVCVPLSHFADIITATARNVRESGVVGPW
jgi:D-lactate dehydrogenase (cytochrome)